MRNKRAEGYLRSCIMIFIFCIGIAVFMSYITAVSMVKISKRNTYKIIDGYVTECSIEAYNSIKFGTDYLETFDEESFKEYFCQYNDLQQLGNTYIAKTEQGEEKYRVTDLNLSFIEDKTLKMQVDYIINIPISFGSFDVFNAEVPITVKTKLTDKF